jgi:hypothetical protein
VSKSEPPSFETGVVDTGRAGREFRDDSVAGVGKLGDGELCSDLRMFGGLIGKLRVRRFICLAETLGRGGSNGCLGSGCSKVGLDEVFGDNTSSGESSPFTVLTFPAARSSMKHVLRKDPYGIMTRDARKKPQSKKKEKNKTERRLKQGEHVENQTGSHVFADGDELS